MKRLALLAVILMLALTLLLPGPAVAQSGVSAAWTSNIAYFNYGNTAGEFTAAYYPQGAVSPTATQTVSLQPYQAGELAIGQSFSSDFTGSVLVGSSVPLAAVHHQLVSGQDRSYSPVLYTAFDESHASSEVFIPSFNWNPSLQSMIGIQNAETFETHLRLDFYAPDGSLKVTTAPNPLPAQAGTVFDPTADPALSAQLKSFVGSLIIHGYKDVNDNDIEDAGDEPARLVAAVQEVERAGRRGFAFEGLTAPAAAGYVYMPTSMCRFGRTQQTTSFTVQYASSQASDPEAAVFIRNFTDNGAQTSRDDYKVGTVKPGARLVVSTCSSRTMIGKSGWAVIYAKNENTLVKLVAVGKTSSNDGLMTAFVGQAAGGTRIILPYAPWGRLSTDDRAYISVVNISGAPIDHVTVNYYYKSGASPEYKAVHTLAKEGSPLKPNNRRSSTAQSAPAALSAPDGFTGGVIIQSDQPVIALVRVQRSVTRIPRIRTLGEDYNGLIVTP